ncbi:MAG: hypothetical protein ACLR8Y_00055 [Alistipes indistinctus]
MLILLLYTLYLRESHLHPVITSRAKKLVAIARHLRPVAIRLGGASPVFLTSVIDQTMLAGMEGLMQGGIYAINDVHGQRDADPLPLDGEGNYSHAGGDEPAGKETRNLGRHAAHHCTTCPAR